MTLRTSIAEALLSTADVIETYLEFGVNHSTAKKDERAWTMWEVVCGLLGTSPMRTAQDARDRPERNAHLLAVLMSRRRGRNACSTMDKKWRIFKPVDRKDAG